ncbi:MAG TPA: cytochrome c-type biogenesis protein CcmH [Thermoanaerobaculia bacterium]
MFALLLMLLDAPAGPPLRGEALTQRTQEIAATLRCPVCQGLSIADSPSEMAVNMKNEVRSMLERGYTREQIEAYFVRSYGEFVLLEPRTPVIWILPVAALVLGIAIVAIVLRRLTSVPPQKKRNADDPDLARVRELVKGATS